MLRYVVFILAFFSSVSLLAQEQHEPNHFPTHFNSTNHHSFRIAVLIGHTLIPEKHAGENFFVPSWGLDLEYWYDSHLGIGLHSDIELETFAVIGEYGPESMHLERVMPVVVSLDLLYRPWKGLVFQFGPGMEFERSENFSLLRFGLEYEVNLGRHFDLAPTFFCDNRFDGYKTYTIALGIGKRF